MGQWLIEDLSLSDVHFQPSMLLVTGVVLIWFLYVCDAIVLLEICIKFTAPAVPSLVTSSKLT
jgi:hypothetical protein